jgi:hypothetical protein
MSWWRKEDCMYEFPTMDEVGSASELIQALYGPYYDGGGYQFSQSAICTQLEEE